MSKHILVTSVLPLTSSDEKMQLKNPQHVHNRPGLGSIFFHHCSSWIVPHDGRATGAIDSVVENVYNNIRDRSCLSSSERPLHVHNGMILCKY